MFGLDTIDTEKLGMFLTRFLSADLDERQLACIFGITLGLCLGAPRIPLVRHLFYPLAMLGTLVHEMGHGLAAVALGGKFHHIRINWNLGGLATYSIHRGVDDRVVVDSPVKQALIAVSGLLAPSAAGGPIIVLSANEDYDRWVLSALAIAIMASLIFVENLLAWFVLFPTGAAIAAAALLSPPTTRLLIAQLLGIQLSVVNLTNIAYLFKAYVDGPGGARIASDTQQISDAFRTPHWFWATNITVISAAVLLSSFYVSRIMPLI